MFAWSITFYVPFASLLRCPRRLQWLYPLFFSRLTRLLPRLVHQGQWTFPPVYVHISPQEFVSACLCGYVYVQCGLLLPLTLLWRPFVALCVRRTLGSSPYGFTFKEALPGVKQLALWLSSPIAKLTNHTALHEPRTSQTWSDYPSHRQRRAGEAYWIQPTQPVHPECLTVFSSPSASSNLLWPSFRSFFLLWFPPFVSEWLTHSECFYFWNNRLIALSHNLAQLAGVWTWALRKWHPPSQYCISWSKSDQRNWKSCTKCCTMYLCFCLEWLSFLTPMFMLCCLPLVQRETTPKSMIRCGF